MNCLLKGLGQVLGGIQNSTVVDVGDVDHELVVIEFCLRGFHSDAALASDTSNSDFRNTSEERLVGRVFCGRVQCPGHDFCRSVATVASAAEVSGQFSASKVGQNGGGR